jgi:hypothetical protein
MTSNEGVFGNEVLCATFCDIGHTSVILYCLRIQIRCSSSRCRVCESAPEPEAVSLKDRFLFFIATRGESYLNLLFKTSLARGYQSNLGFSKSGTVVGVARSGKSEPVVVSVHCYWL